MVKRSLCIALSLLVAASVGASVAPVSVDVELPGGTVRGVIEGDTNVVVWRGIPYAAPPVADLRWRPPQQPKPWRPTVLLPKINPGCSQIKHSNPPHMQGDEDCLVLNVFAPYNGTSGGSPVLLWIHGGGYEVGSGTGYDTDGTFDVGNLGSFVIVAINYRLSIFGFGASDALRTRDPLGGTGNYGILDQALIIVCMRSCALV